MVDSGIVTRCTSRTLQWVLEKGLCSSPTLMALSNLGFQKLTHIQLLALPVLLSKTNAFLHARTGSGKTLAFLIPTVERLKAMGFKTSHGKRLTESWVRWLALWCVQTFSYWNTIVLNHDFSSCLQLWAECHSSCYVCFSLHRCWCPDYLPNKRASTADCTCPWATSRGSWLFFPNSNWRHKIKTDIHWEG